MIILSIETSCDETAVAIVEFSLGKAKVLSNIVSSQIKMHKKYGGVVPSLASRMHLKNTIPVLNRAFKQAKIKKDKIDYIAVTNGPGLIPALMIGVSAAKTLSFALKRPLIGINHIEGHIYANWLDPICNSKIPCLPAGRKNQKPKNLNENIFDIWDPEFPILCLTVSGGHTQLILMKKDLNYKIIGETIDDAAGEAFDKVAKLLDLGYPGGPIIEKMARSGDAERFKFTPPMMQSKDYNFSFSGLKTAVLYEIKKKEGNIDLKYKKDMAASFQKTVIDVLVSKTVKAAKEHGVKNILLGGGVSANEELRKRLSERIKEEISSADFHFPLFKLTTDNALMISVAAYYHALNKKGISGWKEVRADSNLTLA